MRVKKQKQVRRSVRFYKTCCGFREPFKVLCDGNFVHAALIARMGGLQETLTSFMGGATKSFVTRCVIQELRKLGDDFSGTVIAARRLNIAKCNHEPTVAATECVEALLGKNNPEHFFIGTQDGELRKKIRKVPGGGVLFVQNTGLIMEPPSTQQLAYARLSEAERLHMADREQKIIDERARRKAEAAKAAIQTPGEEGLSGREENPDTKERPKKRKRPKGPNPLSQMKKKGGGEANASIAKTSSEEQGVNTAKNKKRHRVRRRKPGSTTENGGESE